MRKFVKFLILTNVTKGLKLRQVDKTQSLENEESCRLIKEHFGNGSFLSWSLKMILLAQSKSYHQIKHQSQMTYPFQ